MTKKCFWSLLLVAALYVLTACGANDDVADVNEVPIESSYEDEADAIEDTEDEDAPTEGGIEETASGWQLSEWTVGPYSDSDIPLELYKKEPFVEYSLLLPVADYDISATYGYAKLEEKTLAGFITITLRHDEGFEKAYELADEIAYMRYDNGTYSLDVDWNKTSSMVNINMKNKTAEYTLSISIISSAYGKHELDDEGIASYDAWIIALVDSLKQQCDTMPAYADGITEESEDAPNNGDVDSSLSYVSEITDDVIEELKAGGSFKGWTEDQINGWIDDIYEIREPYSRNDGATIAFIPDIYSSGNDIIVYSDGGTEQMFQYCTIGEGYYGILSDGEQIGTILETNSSDGLELEASGDWGYMQGNYKR